MTKDIDTEIKKLKSKLKDLEQQRKLDPISSVEKEGLRRYLKSIDQSNKLDKVLEEARHYRHSPEVLSIEVKGDSVPLRFERILQFWKRPKSIRSNNTIIFTSAGKFLVAKEFFGGKQPTWPIQIEVDNSNIKSSYDESREADWLSDTYESAYSDAFIQSLRENQPIPQEYVNLIKSQSFTKKEGQELYPDVIKRCEIGRLQYGLQSLFQDEQMVYSLVKDDNPIDVPLSSLSRGVTHNDGFKFYDDSPGASYQNDNKGLIIMSKAIIDYCQDVNFLQDLSPLDKNFRDILTEYMVLEKIS